MKTVGIIETSEMRWCPGAAAKGPYIIDLLGIIIKYMDQLMYQQNIDTSPKTLNGWPQYIAPHPLFGMFNCHSTNPDT